MNKPLYGKYKTDIQYFYVPKPLKANFAKQFMTNKIIQILKSKPTWKKH